jgi:hypothetical protein
MLGADQGNYILAATTETDENMVPKAPVPSTAVFIRNRIIQRGGVRRW